MLGQKDKYPAWAIENWHVYPDPRARFADPSCPDRPPKPPDDPAAYDLSPNPQKPGKAGVAWIEGNGYLDLIAQWDLENRAKQAQEEEEEKRKTAEPPLPGEEESGHLEEEKFLPPLVQEAQPKQDAGSGQAAQDAMAKAPAQEDAITEAKARSRVDTTGQPTYLLTLDQAAELAMFNSRIYQDRREQLYLAALPVTQERFSFMAQAFAASEAVRAFAGPNAPGGQANNWTLNNDVGLSKVLPTGALLLFNFANTTVFDFLSPKMTSSTSTINFNAIQPLLRGGGQAVALESLTQAERNLLYVIRDYARFRKELYVAVASNNGGAISGGTFQPVGVLSNNNDFSPSGLGFLGVTPGVIAPIATSLTTPQVPPSTPGTLNLSAVISPPPSGYLNTMLQKIQVYIDQENIDVLSGILLRFRGLLEGDVVQPLQVQNVEQQLLSGRTTLLNDQVQYLAALDSFKLEIGVPMDLSIEMDDSVLRPLMKQFRRSRAIIENEQAAVTQATKQIELEKAPGLRAELLRLFTKSAIVKGTAFVQSIRPRWAEWEKLSDKDLLNRLKDLRAESQELLDQEAELQRKDQALNPVKQARLKELGRQLDLGNFESALRFYESNYVADGKPKKPADAAGERRRLTLFQNTIYTWQKVLVEARDDQWEVVRASWPELPRCCVDGVDLIKDSLDRAKTTAGQHALVNRLDLMNVRAQVVDAWRQLAVYANALLGVFNVQYQLNANTVLGPSTTSHQLILNSELPLARIQERNNYRASLIAYQKSRRALQEAEDLSVQAVNGQLYLLREYVEAYKIQKRQLELAYLTIDSSLESLEAPTAPPAPAGLPRAVQDGPAGLTQQLLAAQRSLPAAQNGLLTIWINYLDARLQLYRDLELMPLDARGVWIDEVRDCDCGIGLEPSADPIAPPAETGPQFPDPQPLPVNSVPAIRYSEQGPR